MWRIHLKLISKWCFSAHSCPVSFGGSQNCSCKGDNSGYLKDTMQSTLLLPVTSTFHSGRNLETSVKRLAVDDTTAPLVCATCKYDKCCPWTPF